MATNFKIYILGIGRESAIQFAKEGAHVIATDVCTSKLADLETIENIDIMKVDVLNKEDILKLVSKAGIIDVLFNCAG